MVPYQPAAWRPRTIARPASRYQLGKLSDMSLGDGLLLVGGVIVGGAGVNGLIGMLSGGKLNAISLGLDIVLVAVGGTLFVQNFKKMIA